ncbi:riboflavin synthase [Gilvibacter sediminis]|uniref:riboflavin synthase n=1 Tax=Gilvibacter sediminis TaxID=379071 RepID=UPI002350F34B|nr:riboflavin synthase [Gilvibacter sediminis]MDC7996844.1 riboflavin synthase [Gilvibacter sediminis]
MFTGIIEEVAEVVKIERDGGNIHISMQAQMTPELQIDQSVAHNGVCLTVVAIDGNQYTVTAIDETLQKSNLGELAVGSGVNLERAMKMGARLDGHIVQGHVDQTATCIATETLDGSWTYRFRHDLIPGNLTIEKGSITVNGVSLTVVDSTDTEFSVAIIPYTHEHTNFHALKAGDTVNLEFDVVGKYVQKLLKQSS